MSTAVVEINAQSKERWSHFFRDLWNYRELVVTFIERDLRLRYKQTFLGVVWVLLYPILFSGLFSIIFGHVGKMDNDHLPYPLFYLAALVPWQCFATGLTQAAGSLEGNSGLISKIYFPRIIVPISVLLGTIVDFVIGWIFFNAAAIFMGLWTWKFIVFTPVLLVLQLVTALGAGLIFSALNAQYRDVRYVVPFIVQVGMFISPVVFSISRLPYWLEWGAWINPMAGVIETYRALLARDHIPYRLLAKNMVVAGVLLFYGIRFFQKRIQRIIDIL